MNKLWIFGLVFLVLAFNVSAITTESATINSVVGQGIDCSNYDGIWVTTNGVDVALYNVTKHENVTYDTVYVFENTIGTLIGSSSTLVGNDFIFDTPIKLIAGGTYYSIVGFDDNVTKQRVIFDVGALPIANTLTNFDGRQDCSGSNNLIGDYLSNFYAIGVSTYAEYIGADLLILNLTFDADDSTDYSVANSVIADTNMQYVSGLFGESAYFDGSGYMDVNSNSYFDSITNKQQFTTAFWVNATQNNAYFYEFFNNLVALGIGNGGQGDDQLTLWVNPSYDTGNCFVDYGEWQHIALTYDNGNLIYYKNGVQCDTGTIGTISSPITKIIIGTSSAYGSNGETLIGHYDNFLVYNYPLSGVEIEALATPPVSTPTINRTYFDCDYTLNNPINTLIDSYGNYNMTEYATDVVTAQNGISNTGCFMDIGVDSNAGFQVSDGVPPFITVDLTGKNAHSVCFAFNTISASGELFSIGDTTNNNVITVDYENNNIQTRVRDQSNSNVVTEYNISYVNNTWNDYCYVTDGSTVDVYLNGQLEVSSQPFSPDSFGNSYIAIGSFFTSSGYLTIDEIEIDYYELSALDVENRYNFFNFCTESWSSSFTSCSGGFKTKFYTDVNTCGTYNDLPVDNNTQVICIAGGGGGGSRIIPQSVIQTVEDSTVSSSESTSALSKFFNRIWDWITGWFK